MCRYVFHYVVDNGVVYMCMADKDSKRRIPFAYLNDIKSRFEEMYGATIMTAVENNMNEEFSKVMEKRMVLCVLLHFTHQEFYNNDPSADTITHVRGQIKEVKEVMVDNIGKTYLLLLIGQIKFLVVVRRLKNQPTRLVILINKLSSSIQMPEL